MMYENYESIGNRPVFTPAFAEIYIHNSATPQAIAPGVTYTKLTAYTLNGQSQNCTADAANQQIVIEQTGRYFVNAEISMISGTANIIYLFAVFLNGVEQDQIHTQRKLATAGDVGAAGVTGFINAVAGDIIDIRARHDNIASVNLTLVYSNLNVLYMG